MKEKIFIKSVRKAPSTGLTERPFAMAPMVLLIRSINGLLPTAILSVHRLSRLASIFSKPA